MISIEPQDVKGRFESKAEHPCSLRDADFAHVDVFGCGIRHLSEKLASATQVRIPQSDFLPSGTAARIDIDPASAAHQLQLAEQTLRILRRP